MEHVVAATEVGRSLIGVDGHDLRHRLLGGVYRGAGIESTARHAMMITTVAEEREPRRDCIL